MATVDLKELTLGELEAWIAELGEQRFRADQIFRWVHRHGARSIDTMTDLSRAFRERLAGRAIVGGLRLAEVLTDPDGTRKLLLDTHDDLRVESVLIPMETGATLCVSSQVGCNLGCGFCLTGRRRKTRDLTAGEIVDQVTHAAELLRGEGQGGEHVGRALGNLVFMGMGEPLDNYDALVRALRVLQHPHGPDFSSRRVTVSTAGLVPGIDRLAKEPDLSVNLAVSLNATTDDVRTKVMPVNRAHPLGQLMAALRRFPVPRRRRITVEYVLLAGVNDAPADARRLTGLLHGLRCKVNLLAFNPWPGAPYTRPAGAAVHGFQELLRQRGLTATVRESRGSEVGAACGTLGGEAVTPRG